MSIAGAFGISVAITSVLMTISIHKIDEGGYEFVALTPRPLNPQFLTQFLFRFEQG